MKSMVCIRNRVALCLAFVLLLTAAAGCSLVNDPEPPAKEGGDVDLTFRVVSAANLTGHSGTRTDDNDHDEEDSQQPNVEDYININDFQFHIFAGESKDNATLKLLYSCTKLADNPDVTYVGGMGVYDIHITVSEETMKKFFGDDAYDINSKTPVYFRVMAIANSNASQSATAPATPTGSGTQSTDFNTMMTSAKAFTYTLTAPDYALPMYGLGPWQTTTLYELSDSRPEEPTSLGSVTLLRAVSKVRIADEIPRQPGNEYPRIASVNFTYASRSGYVLPANADAYIDGTQVHTFNIPEQTDTDNTINLVSGKETVDNGTVTATETVFYGYCPEQRIGTATPQFVINIQPSQGVALTTYTVPMAGYNGNPFTWAGSEGMLLRNHIYTLAIGLNTTQDLTITVCPRATFTTDIPPFE